MSASHLSTPFKTRELCYCRPSSTEWLQIDTDLLRIITSTADELSGVPTLMTLNDLEPPKYGF